MDHYIDIHTRPDPDFPAPMLMGALYAKLHRALHDLDAQDIGISLPDHKTGARARTPGQRLRLHSTQDRLNTLMAMSWLNGMRDHLTVEAVKPVPPDARHRTVRRRQFNTGGPSRIRRYAKRHGVSEHHARSLMAGPADRKITLPFIQIASRSTGERFALFIEHGNLQREPVDGTFNHYGLSQQATIPWF